MAYILNFALLFIIYQLFFYRRWRGLSKREFGLRTMMYVYFSLVLFVTLMPFPIPLGATNHLYFETANFIPFRDLRLQYGGAEREIILNMIMMIPFVFLYPLIYKKGIIRTVSLTCLFSLSIETFQLFGSYWDSSYIRSFDVTDLITNTTGGLIGYIIFKLLHPIQIVFFINDK